MDNCKKARRLVFIAIVLAGFFLPACQSAGIVPENPYTGTTDKRMGIDCLWYGISQYNMEANLPVLAANQTDLKSSIIRFDIYWYFLEPSRGNFDWSMTDAVINALPADAELLFTVYCTASWAIKERRDASNNLITSIMPSTAPLDYNDYYNFIHALVSRYKSRVKYYQVENEVYAAENFWLGTSGEYLTLLQSAYNAVKSADSSSKVLPASIAFGTIDVTQPVAPAYQEAFDFINLVYSSGKNYFDIADAHLYYTLDSITARLQWLCSLMADNSISKPIWVTETGGLDSRAYANYTDTAEQAREMVKRYVLAYAGNAQKVFWLSVHKEKDTEAPPWADMKLTEDAAAQVKKPAYYTLKLLISKLDNFTAVQTVSNGYKFTVAGKPVLVLWNDTAISVDVSGQLGTASVLLTHLVTDTGNIIPVTENVTATAVPIDIEPVFVEKAP